jgi:DtxR family transcriptional regulator, Mn-dependent transcriptional regulator
LVSKENDMPVYVWIFALIFIGLLAVFLPKYGGLARFSAWQELRQREWVEDALKHLLDREQQGRHASPESLAGTLEISPKKAMKLVAQMETQKLVEHDGMQIHLTSEGERWALHVVRAHRLWERYLADEARMPLGKIHGEAHRREHAMSDSQLDAMDAALGHPATDPHGDPIPSREGQLRSVEATPLTAWQAEGSVRIVPLEDEPAIAYEQILAAGLRLGQVIRILEKTPERYVLTDGESEFRLAPSVAANVHVAALPESETILQGAVPLWQLAHEQKAEILALDEGVQGFTRRRFLDLGLTPGTLIFPELQNFFGEPRAYRIRGTLIALRKDQASQIWVKPV